VRRDAAEGENLDAGWAHLAGTSARRRRGRSDDRKGADVAEESLLASWNDGYGVPPERVIGSALGLDFDASDGGSRLLYKSTTEFFDDGPQKPIRIWSRIGRRPVVVGGNSNGDIPMMQFAGTGGGTALRLLVLHDDADREFAYTAGAEDALAWGEAHGWIIVSIKDDWRAVFADKEPSRPAPRHG
jgi:hypothetical protein